MWSVAGTIDIMASTESLVIDSLSIASRLSTVPRKKSILNQLHMQLVTLLTIVKIVVLQQTEDAEGQDKDAAHVEIVAFAPHRPRIGQGYQYTTYNQTERDRES